MMLRTWRCTRRPSGSAAALERTIREGDSLTPDLGGSGSTTEFTDALIRRL
jgi:isocitrate/isopropylmalate dehydrogenase